MICERRRFLLVAILIFSSFSCKLRNFPEINNMEPEMVESALEQSAEKQSVNNIMVSIPTSLITKLFSFNYDCDQGEIINHFIEIVNNNHIEEEEIVIQDEDQWFINPIILDIDEDEKQEILALYGRHETRQSFLFLKK